jgi:hypothetical protein
MSEHLTQHDFLLYVDGELSRRRTRKVRDHLLSCWSCRREMERLEQDIGAIVDAQNRSFLPSLPRPARPWRAFDELADELAATLPARRSRSREWFRFASGIATASATVLVVVALSIWLLIPSRLSADAVLKRVEQVDLERARTSNNGVIRQRVRIERTDRANSAKRAEEVESWKSGSRAVWRGDNDNLQRRYQDRGLGDALPLSAAAWENWLQSTKKPIEISGAPGVMRLESDMVSLLVDADNWHVQEMRLTFTDSVFDISELDFAVLDRHAVSPDVLAALDLPGAIQEVTSPKKTANTKTAIAPSYLTDSPDLADLELGVEFQLHQIAADLSEPIEVSRGVNQVVIRATGASEERKRQLVEMFSSDKNIRLELEQISIPGTGTSSPILIGNSERTAEFDKRVVDFFGGFEAQENFARSVLAADASILARLYALSHLAKRWPNGVDSTLSAESRDHLRAMVNDHGRALNAALPELNRLLAPLMERFCSTAPRSPNVTSWQGASLDGLQSAQNVDTLLRAVLTTSARSVTIDDACLDLSSHLSSLESAAAVLRPEL